MTAQFGGYLAKALLVLGAVAVPQIEGCQLTGVGLYTHANRLADNATTSTVSALANLASVRRLLS